MSTHPSCGLSHLFIAALMALAAVRGPFQALGDGVQTNRVLLSEIKPFREHPTDFVWVEVCNFGNAAVSIAGWRLQDGSGETYDIPSTIAPLPPDGCFVAVFPSGALPTSLTNIPGVVVAQGEVAGRFLTTSHECALFRRGAGNVLGMVDYIAWETREPPEALLANAASEAGLVRNYVGTYRALQNPGDGPQLEVGGTIGRRAWSVPRRPWQVNLALEDSTPGFFNLPGKPWPMDPIGAGFGKCQAIHFWCFGTGLETLQVARDPAFLDLVLECQIGKNASHNISYPGMDFWPEETFYWRVKSHWVHPRDGSPRETSWSDTAEFGFWFEPPPEPTRWPEGTPLPDLPLGYDP